MLELVSALAAAGSEEVFTSVGLPCLARADVRLAPVDASSPELRAPIGINARATCLRCRLVHRPGAACLIDQIRTGPRLPGLDGLTDDLRRHRLRSLGLRAAGGRLGEHTSIGTARRDVRRGWSTATPLADSRAPSDGDLPELCSTSGGLERASATLLLRRPPNGARQPIRSVRGANARTQGVR